MSTKNNSLDLVDLFGAAVIVYMLYYFVTQMVPLLAATSFGQQLVDTFAGIIVLFVLFTTIYTIYTYVSEN